MSDSAASQVHTIDRVRAILNVAWLAILLGIGVQLLVFAVRLALGSDLVGAVLLSNLTQGITWGVIVCVGVAIGVTVERSRALLGGLLGLISGPLGWASPNPRSARCRRCSAPPSISSRSSSFCSSRSKASNISCLERRWDGSATGRMPRGTIMRVPG